MPVDRFGAIQINTNVCTGDVHHKAANDCADQPSKRPKASPTAGSGQESVDKKPILGYSYVHAIDCVTLGGRCLSRRISTLNV